MDGGSRDSCPPLAGLASQRPGHSPMSLYSFAGASLSSRHSEASSHTLSAGPSWRRGETQAPTPYETTQVPETQNSGENGPWGMPQSTWSSFSLPGTMRWTVIIVQRAVTQNEGRWDFLEGDRLLISTRQRPKMTIAPLAQLNTLRLQHKSHMCLHIKLFNVVLVKIESQRHWLWSGCEANSAFSCGWKQPLHHLPQSCLLTCMSFPP